MTEINKQNKQPNYKLRRMLAAGALLLTAGTAVKSLAESTKTPSHNNAEVEIMHEARLNPEKLTLDFKNGAFVFKEGVKVRTTPDTPMDLDLAKSSDKNVQWQVGSGQAIVFDNPVVYDDDFGKTWVGAVITQDGEPKGPEEIADTMVWVNITDLDKQTNSKGESFYDTYGTEYGHEPIAREAGSVVEIGDEGQVTYGGHAIATAHRVSIDAVANLISATAV